MTGMVNKIAEFGQAGGTGGGANNLMALTAEVDCYGRSDVSTTDDPETSSHTRSNTFYRI